MCLNQGGTSMPAAAQMRLRTGQRFAIEQQEEGEIGFGIAAALAPAALTVALGMLRVWRQVERRLNQIEAGNGQGEDAVILRDGAAWMGFKRREGNGLLRGGAEASACRGKGKRCAQRTLRASRSLRTLRTLRTLRALRALRTFLALRALRTFRALRTLRPDGAEGRTAAARLGTTAAVRSARNGIGI